VCRKLGQYYSIETSEQIDLAKQARVSSVIPRLGMVRRRLGRVPPLDISRLRVIRRHDRPLLRYVRTEIG